MKKQILLLLVVVMLGAGLVALAQDQPTKTIKHVAVRPTSPASGEEMYTSYCAVCHGTDLKGNGPAASAMKVQPTDLTLMAKKSSDGKYPYNRVASAIQGDVNLPAHGSKDMPVWGSLFWHMSSGHQSEVQQRVSNLSKYIESKQAK
jgi:mono/diheme cytochrome c family protein